MSTQPNRTFDRTLVWIGIIVLVGLGYRAWLADKFYPMAGDPTYSYTYRALLISEGDFRGVTVMWHPPGLPLLLAALTKLGLGILSPYGWGVALSLASYVGLTFVVDRLIAPRVASPTPRLIAACFLAFYETLAVWSIGPLTEPIYLLAVYGAVLLLDRTPVSMLRAAAAGLLIGAAFTFRLEAAAPAVGLALLLLVWRRPQTLAAFIIGGFVAGGWLLAEWDYLKFCAETQRGAYTIPPVQGLAAQLKRLVECGYYAATSWLPFALLLPYWILAAYGLLHAGQSPGRKSLHAGLLAVVVPSLALVAMSIMHKRTASFLLPAAAVWTALGVEFLDGWCTTYKRAARLIPAAVVALIVADMGRTAYRLQRDPRSTPASFVAASILSASDSPAGRVWAFGMEPEIYAFRNQATYYPYRERDADYQRLYLEHQGRLDEFVAALRVAGYRYLVVRIGPPTERGFDDPATYDNPKVRADLIGIAYRSDSLRLKRLGSRPAHSGDVQVDVYEILGP
jgi:hypothetical protein